MTRYRIEVSLTLVLIAGGCASTNALREINFQQRDLPEVSAIEVSYQNKSRIRMCLLPEHWPNSAGAIADAEDKAFLVVGDKRFPMKSFNSGSCIHGCRTEVLPGKTLVTRIPYELFELPIGLRSEHEKRLEFAAMAFPCR